MSRLLRFIPDGGSLVEVTCRSIHSRLLLRPGHSLNEIIIGALARSKRLYGVRIICFSFVSNHFHLLLEVDDARQLAPCMAILRLGTPGPDSSSQVVSGAPADPR